MQLFLRKNVAQPKKKFALSFAKMVQSFVNGNPSFLTPFTRSKSRFMILLLCVEYTLLPHIQGYTQNVIFQRRPAYSVSCSNYCLLMIKPMTGERVKQATENLDCKKKDSQPRAAVVHFNFRAGSTFPIPVCTVPNVYWVNKADTQ